VIIRKERARFGFIHIGDGSKPSAEVPRIYFSLSNLKDSNFIVRKGYPVQFICKEDDQKRIYAADVELTEAGKAVADEREAEITAKRAERANDPSNENNERRVRRPRKPIEDKLVTLKVTCEGKPSEKLIEFNLAQSVGKLKNVATSEFEAPLHYNVFYKSSANSEEVFLTRAILVTLNPNDWIHLAEPKGDAAPK